MIYAPTRTGPSRLSMADGWAHVGCSDGWPAWGGGRRLQPGHAPEPQVSPVPVLGAIGLALILLGTFLPWFTRGAMSVSSWRAPLWFVLANKTTIGGPKTGIALLMPLILLAPWLARRRVHWLVTTLLAAVATTLPVEAVARCMQLRHGIHAGVGVLVTLSGGLILAGEAWRSTIAQ